MEEPTLPSPSDLIRITITIAGIDIALAAFTLERGPLVGGLRVVPFALLVAGLPAVVGALYAVAELFWEANLTRSDLIRLTPRRSGDEADTPYTREAILYTAWSLYLLFVAYAAIILLTVGA